MAIGIKRRFGIRLQRVRVRLGARRGELKPQLVRKLWRGQPDEWEWLATLFLIFRNV
jgi:hypothetical protein